MLEARERLGDGRVAAARKRQDAREIVVHAGLAADRGAPARGADRAHGQGIAPGLEVPHDEIVEMDRLLQDPGADPAGVVAPAARPRAIGVAEQAEIGIGGPADRALVDQPLDGAPLARQPELVADVDQAIVAPGGRNQAVATLDRIRHRLLEQKILAGRERRLADLGVGVVGRHHVDHADRRVGHQVAVVAVDGKVRKIGPGACGRVVAARADRREPRARHPADALRVQPAEGAIAHQPEPHRICVGPRHAALPAARGTIPRSVVDRQGGPSAQSARPVSRSNRCMRARSG